MKQRIIVILGLFITIALLLIFIIQPNKTIENPAEMPRFQLMKIQHTNKLSTSILGIITPKHPVVIYAKATGQITEGNPVLTIGKSVKKNDVIIKMERLNLLYKLLQKRATYKKTIQSVIPKLTKTFPSEKAKWNTFEKQIQQTHPLPELPIIHSEEENEYLSNLGVFEAYYTIKNIKQSIANRVYIAPENGTIIKNNAFNGSTIKKGAHLLTIAKNNRFQAEAALPLSIVPLFSQAHTIVFTTLKGDSIGFGKFNRIDRKLSDSTTVRAYFDITEIKSNPASVIIKLPTANKKELVYLPKTAIQNDSVRILVDNSILKIGVRCLQQKGDSIEVKGLPDHCYVIIGKI